MVLTVEAVWLRDTNNDSFDIRLLPPHTAAVPEEELEQETHDHIPEICLLLKYGSFTMY